MIDALENATEDQFIIERDSPPQHWRAGHSKYPLHHLEVGEAMTAKASPGALVQAVRRYKQRSPGVGRFIVRNCGGAYSKVYRVA